MANKTYWILTYNSDSGDSYLFLFKDQILHEESFLVERLPWELEDGSLYGSWDWSQIELED